MRRAPRSPRIAALALVVACAGACGGSPTAHDAAAAVGGQGGGSAPGGGGSPGIDASARGGAGGSVAVDSGARPEAAVVAPDTRPAEAGPTPPPPPDGSFGPPFVAVGYATMRASSDDGKSWMRAPDPTMLPAGWVGAPVSGDNMWLLRGGCWGRGRYVAVGGSGDKGLLLTSTDARTWTVVGEQGNDDCAYGMGLFVTNSRTSPDGVTWTKNAKSVPVRQLAFGDGVFVAVGDHEGGNVSYSRDGRTWTDLAITYKGTPTARKGYNAVAYGGGRFVALNLGQTAAPIFEWDGKSDTSFTEKPRADVLGESVAFEAVAYGRGAHVIATFGFLFRRPAGATTWQKVKYTGTNQPLSNLTITDALYFTEKAWSTDGVAWTASANPPPSVTKIIVSGP
jgi:hypothetical protein